MSLRSIEIKCGIVTEPASAVPEQSVEFDHLLTKVKTLESEFWWKRKKVVLSYTFWNTGRFLLQSSAPFKTPKDL